MGGISNKTIEIGEIGIGIEGVPEDVTVITEKCGLRAPNRSLYRPNFAFTVQRLDKRASVLRRKWHDQGVN